MIEPQQQAGRSRRWPIVIVAIAAVVIVGAALLIWLQVNRGAAPKSSPAPREARTPADPLADVAWVRWHRMRLPVSETRGPRDTNDDRARGFSHDRSGAVLAAIHIGIRTLPESGPKVFAPTIREQVIGDFRDDYLTYAREQYGSMSRDGTGLPLDLDVRGYQVDQASADHVRTTVLVGGVNPSGQGKPCRATRMDMYWRSGDWRMMAPPHPELVDCTVAGYTAVPGSR